MSAPNPHPAQEPASLRLDELNADALSKLFEHLVFKAPLKLACRALRDAGPTCRGSYFTERIDEKIGAAESLKMIRWTMANGWRWSKMFDMYYVVRGGDLEAFVWALKSPPDGPGLELSKIAIKAAARYGHVHILDKMEELGTISTPVGLRAALRRKMVGPYDMGVDRRELWFAAACEGHVNVLAWLESTSRQGEAARCYLTVAHAGCAHGHLHVLQWVETRKALGYAHCMCVAVERGHLHVVRHVYEHSGIWNSDYFEGAVNFNQRAVLEWAREQYLVSDADLHRGLLALTNGYWVPPSPEEIEDGDTWHMLQNSDFFEDGEHMLVPWMRAQLAARA